MLVYTFNYTNISIYVTANKVENFVPILQLRKQTLKKAGENLENRNKSEEAINTTINLISQS